jgi:formate-dependent nitrite reductase membrane component NrfD
MDITFVYEIQHSIAFGPLIVLYFFLAGLSAGLFLLSTPGAVFGREELQSLAKPLSALALAAIIPGGLSLLVDLGQPLRALYLFTSFNPLSVMSWGSYILLVYSIIAAVYAWLVWRGDTRRKAWGWAGIVASVALGLYTGVLLAVAPGHPLWNSAVVPVLFLVSGVVAALSLLSVCQALGALIPGTAADHALHSLKVLFVALELVLIAAHLIILGLIGSSGTDIAGYLVTGARSFSFLGVQIILGTVIPLAIVVFAHRSRAALGVAGLLSLVGVMALRYNFVIAGQELPAQGTLMNALEGGGAVWAYTAALLALSVALGYLIPGFLGKYCGAAPASTRVVS